MFGASGGFTDHAELLASGGEKRCDARHGLQGKLSGSFTAAALHIGIALKSFREVDLCLQFGASSPAAPPPSGLSTNVVGVFEQTFWKPLEKLLVLLPGVPV
ncbi:hypothetical protein EYF80_055542 [Liparis tanakae]|uniref:Uncharacterized protein n=1 Tax=Liparis tanakae TaxID=230148 RepID=A0A4Z2F0W8_9TELE|nr:hypothetical protein EYF80_055542 [Liparis tanakae]